MNEHRREILQMLSERKISTDEAERLLAALDKERPAAEEGPQRRPKFLRAMRQRGVTLDLAQIKPENLEELIDQLGEMTVDVNNEDVRVRVYCE